MTDREAIYKFFLVSQLRRVEDALDVQFITFSCDHHRRRRVDHDQPKRILLGFPTLELIACDARCSGFVIMPDQAQALIWFPKTGQVSRFMQQWTGQSSKAINMFLCRQVLDYAPKSLETDPI